MILLDITYLEMIKRLLLAILLSGLIGLERESINKPAGFRTHILVCIGATIVMIVSIKMYQVNQYNAELDPTRLGAQVISGIGFLGAGTIIREGTSVKGLTTAASLWTIGCIGLAVGAGFYMISILATFFILVTLLFFSKLENYYTSKKNLQYITITAVNQPGQLGRIGDLLGSMNIMIKNIEVNQSSDEKIMFDFTLKSPSSVDQEELIRNMLKVEGILSVKSLY